MNNGLRSFPEQLYSRPVKITNITGFSWFMDAPQEVFYSVKDGNWDDPTVWQTVSGRPGKIPTNGSDVYIKHIVSTNLTANTSYTVNNLFVKQVGYLKFTGTGGTVTVFVTGNIQCVGTIDMLGVQFGNLTLSGNNNFINKNGFLTTSGTGTVTYSGNNQAILDLNYARLSLSAGGSRYFVSNITVSENFTNNGILEIGSYNLTVTGTSTVGALTKSGAGNLLFIGLFTFSGAVNFSGNPSVEFRGGLSSNGGINSLSTGTGTFNFSTNNQNITLSLATVFNAPVLISGIAVSNVLSGTGSMQINNTLDGTAGGSFVNKGILLVNTTTVLMATAGTVDFTGFTNTVSYIYTGSGNIDKGAFNTLTISGGGTKSLVQNTTASGGFTVASGTILQLVTFDFSVTGATTLNGGIIKSGAGNVIFGGLVTGGNSTGYIDFSAGNPTVTMRGGYATVHPNAATAGGLKTGTGVWTFSTNSQSISATPGDFMNFDAPMLISGAITVTISGFTFAVVQVSSISSLMNGGFNINNTVDGNNASSILKNSSVVTFTTTSTVFATLGSFDFSSVANTVGYAMNSIYTLPATSYSGLYIGGSGVKSLSGTTALSGNLTLGSTTAFTISLECSTFDLSVAGTSDIGIAINTGSLINSTLSKTGAGNILFTGLLTLSNNNTAAIAFSGNPTVELQGGIATVNAVSVSSGTGVWKFSTNNQNIQGNTASPAGFTLAAPVLISGAITLTLSNASTSGAYVFTGVLNGNNASSIFDNRSTLDYQNATQPMATGKLYCNQVTNTWRYSLNGNQDITPPGDPTPGYKNLTLSTGGAKRLLGNVSVKGVYTLSAPATLNSNGFALTNP